MKDNEKANAPSRRSTRKLQKDLERAKNLAISPPRQLTQNCEADSNVPSNLTNINGAPAVQASKKNLMYRYQVDLSEMVEKNTLRAESFVRFLFPSPTSISNVTFRFDL